MHDESTTPNPDANADLGTPVGPLSEEVPAGTASNDFDPEAFEQAAAQLRPSWDEIPEPEMLASQDPPPVIFAPAANQQNRSFHAMTLQGTGEIDVPHQVDVVVPRPPRTPQLDMSRLGTSDEDELNDPVSLVTSNRPRRGLWIGVAAVVFVATLAFALLRNRTSDTPPIDTANAVPNVVAPEAAPVGVVAPAPAAPAPTPAVAKATPAPAPAPVKVAPVAVPSPRPELSTRSKEKRSKPSRTKDAATERRTSTSSARSTPSKPKRGAGFVSANPY